VISGRAMHARPGSSRGARLGRRVPSAVARERGGAATLGCVPCKKSLLQALERPPDMAAAPVLYCFCVCLLPRLRPSASLHVSSWSVLAQVTVHGTFGRYARPSREETAAVLEAGGAKLVPVADALAAGADLAITRANCPRSDPKARRSPHSGQAGGRAGCRPACREQPRGRHGARGSCDLAGALINRVRRASAQHAQADA
jgi:hypothetical protein